MRIATARVTVRRSYVSDKWPMGYCSSIPPIIAINILLAMLLKLKDMSLRKAGMIKYTTPCKIPPIKQVAIPVSDITHNDFKFIPDGISIFGELILVIAIGTIDAELKIPIMAKKFSILGSSSCSNCCPKDCAQ